MTSERRCKRSLLAARFLIAPVGVLVGVALLAASAAARPAATVSWAVPHAVSDGATPIPFSWSGRHGRNHRLVIQQLDGAPLKATCVKTGLKRPSSLTVHFWLQEYERQTGPLAITSFTLQPMPQECADTYRRLVFVQVRYKTTLRPWRTLLDYNYNEKPTRWKPIWPSNDGTGGKLGVQSGGFESSKKPWGKVQHVKAQARLWVKELSTERIVGRKKLPVPATYERSARH